MITVPAKLPLFRRSFDNNYILIDTVLSHITKITYKVKTLQLEKVKLFLLSLNLFLTAMFRVNKFEEMIGGISVNELV